MKWLDKFPEIVRAIESDRGQMVLFGLFVREDTPSVVDVVVSANWVNGNLRMDGVRYVVAKIAEVLKPKEMLVLSRIVPMETADPEIKRLVSQLGDVEEIQELDNFVFAGANIISARILIARTPRRRRPILSATK